MLLDRRNDLTLADFCLFLCTFLNYEISHCKQSEFLGWSQENLQGEKIETIRILPQNMEIEWHLNEG